MIMTCMATATMLPYHHGNVDINANTTSLTTTAAAEMEAEEGTGPYLPNCTHHDLKTFLQAGQGGIPYT